MRNAELDDALAIAGAAAEAALGFFRGRLGIEFKADESPVTQADRAVEAEVRRLIADRFPGHGIYGEEHGIEGGDARALWVIDPIDGTRSFISGHPLFGFLLAHLVEGEVELAAVGMPALGEVFAARRGGGAWKDGARLQSSGRRTLEGSTLYVNEGEKIWRAHPETFARLMNAGTTRRFSYDCYPYALLAMGHVDVVVDFDLQPYDYLTVSLLVEEAGGRMTDWAGGRLHMGESVSTVAAATPDLHAAALRLLQG
ncbi:inositol monophosphatase [Frigidibacter sp. RF13]|uniref:inositol monophosphatase family protein n=1 Tax=Frigidibacter sp. RF13 TaxID=2997340 RepID=UPI00226F9AE4|nr:inositol monophosphatase family protein [Frigidibacter sp. RF13]MCY1127808.1 inositol monophosphatase [Frigidibacter sp. RF13]